MRTYIALTVLILAIAGLFLTSRVWRAVAPPELSFTQECLKDGNMWHEMTPLRNGVDMPGEARPGCMTANGLHHFADAHEYREAKTPGASEMAFSLARPAAIGENELRFSVRTADGSVPDLYREHDRYLHVIVIHEDMAFFRHVHPDDMPHFSDDIVTSGDFSVPFDFPEAGTYLVAVDYANKLKHESRSFEVVIGETAEAPAEYPSPQRVDGYDVSLKILGARAGEISTLTFDIAQGDSAVTDLSPYLGAAMHVAIVKNDLREFIHTHGEVHPPGYVPQTVSHVHVPPPDRFGPRVEAHAVFPTAGRYTVFAQFKRGESVVTVPFTVQVQ